MKWFLIVIVTSIGGLFGSDTVSQQKLGPYTTEESCLEAARSVPKRLRWRSNNMVGTSARINSFCVPVEE